MYFQRMCSVRGKALIGLAFALLMIADAASGQEIGDQTEKPRGTAQPAEPDLDSVAFDKWVEKASRKIDGSIPEPGTITDAISERLKNGKFVTDKAVLRGVNAWASYDERSQRVEGTSTTVHYDKTFAIIDKISTLLDGRLLLKARLKTRKAELYSRNDETLNEAIALHQSAMTDFKSLYEELSVDRIENLTILGELLYRKDRKKEAERPFLEVLGFPWYLVEPPTRWALRDRYLRAGRGLIECRRGDLQALESIRFVPATLDLKQANAEGVRRGFFAAD